MNGLRFAWVSSVHAGTFRNSIAIQATTSSFHILHSRLTIQDDTTAHAAEWASLPKQSQDEGARLCDEGAAQATSRRLLADF
jgi:hypothetical protein